MMPWGHFAVAFLIYLVYRLVFHRRLPSRTSIVVLLVGTQFPDLVDKPLAWELHLLPSGRMLAHSVVVAIPVVLLVTAMSVRYQRTGEAGLFSFGYLSHVYTDSIGLLSLGSDYYFLPNLFWPLLPANPDRTPHLMPHLTRIPTEEYVVVLGGLLLFVAWYSYPSIRRGYESLLVNG